jgi:hypothetical protein
MRLSSMSSALAVVVVIAGCGSDPSITVGLPCATDDDCDPAGGMYCGRGFTQLAGDDTPEEADDPLGVIGLMIPADAGYCLQSAGCADDSACPEGAACFRPLDGVAPADVTDVEFDSGDLTAGHCLLPCDSDDDCRVDQGFRCGIPLEEELGGIPNVAEKTFCIPDVVVAPCAPNPAFQVAGTCTLTYDLDGVFEITGTPANQGADAHEVGPGTVVVRVPSDSGTEPSNGEASVLCYDMHQRFGAPNYILTVTRAYSFDPSGAARSTGTLADGTITWDECVPSASYCTSDPWTPEDTATGPGCLAGYTSVGDVYCGIGPLCTVGQLQSEHNPQDDTWTQPMHPFVFSGGDTGFESISMGGPAIPDAVCGALPDWVDERVQIPNRSPGRTWTSFTGTLRTMECTPPS